MLSGRITEAMASSDKYFPNLLKSRPDLLFSLKVQHFIELLGKLNPETFSSGLLKEARASIDCVEEKVDSSDQGPNSTVVELINLGRELLHMRSATVKGNVERSHASTDTLLSVS